MVDRLSAPASAPLAPLHEWLEYTAWTRTQRLAEDRPRPGDHRPEAHLTLALQEEIAERLHREVAAELGWGQRTRVGQVLEAGSRYVTPKLLGEAILTVGGPVFSLRRRRD